MAKTSDFPSERDILWALLNAILAISNRLWPKDEMHIQLKSKDIDTDVWVFGPSQVNWVKRAEVERPLAEILA
jgi:hypothetical protein